jgi:hypothetical protein
VRWVERPGLPGWRLCNSGVSSSGRCCGNTVALLVWAGWYALVGLNLRPYQRFMGLSVFLYDGARCSAKGNRCWCSGGRGAKGCQGAILPDGSLLVVERYHCFTKHLRVCGRDVLLAARLQRARIFLPGCRLLCYQLLVGALLGLKCIAAACMHHVLLCEALSCHQDQHRCICGVCSQSKTSPCLSHHAEDLPSSSCMFGASIAMWYACDQVTAHVRCSSAGCKCVAHVVCS